METKRLYYIDWLRVLVILSLIPFHAALTYLRYGSVYIKAPVSGLAALPFLIVEVPLGDFFMTLLFFAAGMAAFYSLKNKGGGQYIGERAMKLMVPFGLGFFLLCPVQAYFQALYEGFQGGLLNFLPQFFYYKIFDYMGYAHLWFLLYLFVFTLLCVPLFNRWRKDETRIGRIGAFLSRGHRLLLPIGFIVLLEACLRPYFNSGLYVIVTDWANDAVYLSLFVFGYVYAADARIQERIKAYFKPSMVFGALGLATLYYVNVQSQMFYSNEAYLTPLWVLSKGVYECSAIVFLLNIGNAFMNKGGKAIKYLSRASFPIYILHYLPVTAFTYLFLDLQMHIFVKFLLVVVLSYLTVFLCYEAWRRFLAWKKRLPAPLGADNPQ